MKACTRCGEQKPLNRFHRSTHTKDGHAYRCKECANALQKQHRASNQEKSREMGRLSAERRRARVAAMEKRDVPYRERWQLSHSPCFVCGAMPSWRSKDRTTWDHIIPIAKGGRHSIGNLMTLCTPCNLSKGDRFFADWRIRLLKRPPILAKAS